MSEDMAEVSALSRVMTRLQENGPFGPNEGAVRASIVEAPSIRDRISAARNKALTGIFPALIIASRLGQGIVEDRIESELLHKPNAAIEARIEASNKLERELLTPTLLPIVQGTGGLGAAAAISTMGLIADLQLLHEATEPPK